MASHAVLRLTLAAGCPRLADQFTIMLARDDEKLGSGIGRFCIVIACVCLLHATRAVPQTVNASAPRAVSATAPRAPNAGSPRAVSAAAPHVSGVAVNATAAAVPRAINAAVPQPAAWLAHDLVVAFRHLPKRYSCEDLQAKVTDVLLAIGARPESVFPYRCERAVGPQARSPEVHLQFSFPEMLHRDGRASANAGLSVKTVELRPGDPATLTDADCVLLRQLKGTLLTAIPVKILSYRLSCEAPGRAKPLFRLSVSAWTSASSPDSKLAAVNESSGTEQQVEHR